MGCRTVRPIGELQRVRAGPGGHLLEGAGPGRGAWWCRGRLECFDLAVRRRAFERALRTSLVPGATALLRANLVERESMESRPSRGD